MEVCEDNDATGPSELNEQASCLDGKDRMNSNSNVDMKSSEVSHKNSTDISRSCLDENLLLSMFEGNAENLEYYCQLRDLASQWNEKEQGPLVCDPRDLRKVEQIGDWKPKSKTEDLKDLIKRFKAEDLDFPSKQIAVELDPEDDLISEGDSNGKDFVHKDKDQRESFHCGVQGCGDVFTSLALYEAHYRRCHSYACATCRRSFVSSFLLDVHVQENHDSYFQILSSRIDMYRCLVETCSLKFRTADLRKDHMITEHKFPSNFSFHRPLKEVNLSSPVAPDENQMDVAVGCAEGESGDHEPKSHAEETAKKGRKDKKSKAKKNQGVPTTICFGRGSQRAFQRRGRGGRGGHWHQTGRPDADTTVDIESVDMTDLAESLS